MRSRISIRRSVGRSIRRLVTQNASDVWMGMHGEGERKISPVYVRTKVIGPIGTAVQNGVSAVFRINQQVSNCDGGKDWLTDTPSYYRGASTLKWERRRSVRCVCFVITHMILVVVVIVDIVIVWLASFTFHFEFFFCFNVAWRVRNYYYNLW